MGNRKYLSRYKKFIPLYAMFLPGLVYLLINNYLPMLGTVVAFKKFNYRLGLFKSEFIGLNNFEFLFKTNAAYIITRNTLLYNLLFIVLGTALAVGLSVLIFEITSELAKKIYQSVLLVPFLISTTIVSYLCFGFLSTDAGFVNNSILVPLGFKTISWYSTPKYWPFILVTVHLWKNLGYNCIIYYATLMGVEQHHIEAAMIDGANQWQRIWHILLPKLKPTIIILALMAIGRIFYSDFGLFYLVPLNSGPLLDITNTIDTYVYRGLMENSNIGMASAAGLYQSFVGFILVMVTNYIVRKTNVENALF